MKKIFVVKFIIILFPFLYSSLYSTGGAKPEFYISNGKAIFDDSKSIYCVDVLTKIKTWEFQPKLNIRLDSNLENYNYAGIKYFLKDGDKIYIFTNDRRLICLNASDGKVNWDFGMKIGISVNPVIKNNVVYFGGENSSVYAIDLSEKKVKWTYQAAGEITNSLMVGDYLHFGSLPHYFYGLKLAKGLKKWVTETRHTILSNPVMHGDKILVGGTDGTIFAIDYSSGGQYWRSEHFKKYSEEIDIIVMKNNMIFKNNDSVVIVVDIKQLNGLWGFWGRNILARSLIDKDSILYYYGDGVLYAANPFTGYSLWNLNLKEKEISAPVIDGGFYYYKTGNRLKRLDLKTKAIEIIYSWMDSNIVDDMDFTSSENVASIVKNITVTDTIKSKGIGGKVIVNCLIGSNSKFLCNYPVYSDNPLLLDCVMDAIKKTEKFVCPTKDGKNITGWVPVTINFLLKAPD